MSTWRGLSLVLFLTALLMGSAYAQPPVAPATPSPAPTATAAVKPVKAPVVRPYETFITVQNYSLQNSGETGNPISNVHLEITFPNGKKITLPEGGQDWPIGNGQMQPINQTYRLPWKYIQKDGFQFAVQMVRKGGEILPCQFKVEELSQFNRSYVCHTDVNWQETQKIPADQIDREAVQVRVSTDIKENLAQKSDQIPTKFTSIE